MKIEITKTMEVNILYPNKDIQPKWFFKGHQMDVTMPTGLGVGSTEFVFCDESLCYIGNSFWKEIV